MGLLDNVLGSMFGGQSSIGGSSSGASMSPMLMALMGLLATKAVTSGGLGNMLGGVMGGGSAPAGLPGAGGAPNLQGGLGELVSRFQRNGMGDTVNSWIGSGSNQPVAPHQVGQALGPDILNELSQKTGMSTDQLQGELSHILPTLVDKLTPQGRLPTTEEHRSFM